MNKRILVIGASGDIGFQVAEKLHVNGYRLILHGNSTISRLHTLISNSQIDHLLVEGDLANSVDVERMLQHLPEVDGVVFAAGKNHFGTIQEVNLDAIHQQVQLDFVSLVSVCKTFIPKMVTKRNGAIVIISSIWGQIGASNESIYAAMKGAQITFAKSLAKELGPSGIRVNVVAPGMIDTAMNSFSELELVEIVGQIPLGTLGVPQDVANVVDFLLSDKSRYITGQVISVNGGWHLS